jgi:hypothetical protein
MKFGKVGAYEKIKGKLHYAVNLDNPFNAQIVDLQLAKEGRLRRDISEIDFDQGRIIEKVGGDALNDAGKVEFSGDFILLKPVNLNKGNHRLLYDINNRGRPRALPYYNDAASSNDPTTVEHAGNGWLMRQGYSVLWTAWNWDVERVGQNPLRIWLPIIVNEDGSTMVDKINAELTVWDRDGVQIDWFAWGGSRCYKAADDPDLKAQAVLSVRDLPDVDEIGPREIIPREDWQFAVVDRNGDPVPDPVTDADHVYYENTFEKGRIYELIYWAKNPRVVGLGLAAIRDAISFFHFEVEDDYGNQNPLLRKSHHWNRGHHGRKGRPDPQYAYIFGISQSGRVATHMMYQGFHVDEKGRMVFEGARPHVAGGGKGGFNYRWAQTTHHPKHLEGNYFAADHFPFNFTPKGVRQFDPYQPYEQYQDVLAVAKALGKIPKIMIANHGLEYWTRAASLAHTDVSGIRDAITHPKVRVYMVNGTRHGNPSLSSLRTSSTAEHSGNNVDQRPVGRALLVALNRWVTYGIKPPPSAVPRIDRGELVTVEIHKADFPQIPFYTYNGVEFPALRHPGSNLKPPRADYGPSFFMPMPFPGDPAPVPYPGIQDYVPPDYFGPPYETRVPYFDSDGNGIGGIRLPDLTVPLGTYQSWNPRREGTGASDFLKPFDGSFWPFALTKAERLLKGDPRPSIEERYKNKMSYVLRVWVAAWKLQKQGFLLSEDRKDIVGFALDLEWPPVPIETYPFWKLEEK